MSNRLLRLLALSWLCLTVVGCAPGVKFQCTESLQCGANGTCVEGGCAFAATDCPSGLRFDKSVVDSRAGMCVADMPDMSDGMNCSTCGPDLSMPTGADMAAAKFTWVTIAHGTADLRAVSGVGSGADVYAVGDSGTVIHSTDGGATWSAPGWATGIATDVTLYGVWGTAGNNVYAVGAAPGGGYWARSSGVKQQTLSSGDANYFVWGTSQTDVYIGGYGFDNAGTARGGIVQHATTGQNFTVVGGAFTVNVRSVWGASSLRLYAVGDAGFVRISSDSGVSWNGVPTTNPATGTLRSIWGAGQEVFIVGDQGTILHSTDAGVTFSAFSPAPTAQHLRAIWGSSTSDIYVVGDQGVILHSSDDGATWRQPSGEGVSTLPTGNLAGVWGSSAQDVYIVGQSGAIAHGALR